MESHRKSIKRVKGGYILEKSLPFTKHHNPIPKPENSKKRL